MNGLKTEAIARVRRQTRHTEFNNQSVIYKSKKEKACQYQYKTSNNNLLFFVFVLVILSKLKIIQINKKKERMNE